MSEQHQPETLGYVIGLIYQGDRAYLEKFEREIHRFGAVEDPLEAPVSSDLEEVQQAAQVVQRAFEDNPDVQDVRPFALQIVAVEESEADDE